MKSHFTSKIRFISIELSDFVASFQSSSFISNVLNLLFMLFLRFPDVSFSMEGNRIFRSQNIFKALHLMINWGNCALFEVNFASLILMRFHLENIQI